MKVDDLVLEIEKFARPSLAIDGDPIGLCLGRRAAEIEAVVVALDLTSTVIDYALDIKAGLIVTHHPPIYHSIAAITADTPEGEKLITCAENKIALFAAHTNADACMGGTADLLAQQLYPEMADLLPLVEAEFQVDRREGFGRVLWSLDETNESILKRCQDSLLAPFARLVGDLKRPVKSVAVWPGAMDETVVYAATSHGVDLLIAGECKHHLSIMLAERGIDLIAAGHDKTEMAFVGQIAALLRRRFPGLKVETITD